MQRITAIIAILFTKILTIILRFSKKGSGTALPGLLIERHFPSVFDYLICQIPNIIVVTGTNGKTTTQTILRSILESNGITPLTNQAGANMLRGLTSELLKRANILGNVNYKHAIFEVEEATLPKIVERIKPKMIIVTNLFRDQLDAYGEIDITERYIRSAIIKSPKSIVILNNDDPRVSNLVSGLTNKVVKFSLPEDISREMPFEGDTIEKDNPATFQARNIITEDDFSTTFDLGTVNIYPEIQIEKLNLKVPGTFHVYNALAAITAAKVLNISDNKIKIGVGRFNPAFGRGEIIKATIKKKRVNIQVLLIKNPAGFSLNLELLKNVKNLKLMIIINDKIADGKDVSWLWDSKVELVKNCDFDWIMLSGIRAKDMAVRMKYAMGHISQVAPNDDKTFLTENGVSMKVIENIPNAFRECSEWLEDGDHIYVLPTYTAMLEFRKIFKLGLER